MAPEYSTTKSYDTASDMFSLGMLIYALYNRGRTLYDCNDNYSTFMKMSDDLKVLNTTRLSALPMEVREHVKMLLSPRPELRPDASQFTKVPFFEDVGVKTLEYLDSLFQVDNIQRSMFYKSLPQVIDKLPMVRRLSFVSRRSMNISFRSLVARQSTTHRLGTRTGIHQS